MSQVTKTICDRCGEEIIYRGWTAKLPFPKKRPFILKLLKLNNGNPSGYDYFERIYELCNKCTSGKDTFFSDCAEHGIYNFMGERAMLRDYFVCRLCYKDQFSEGRYELMSCDEWQIKENGLFGKYGLEVCDMSSKDLFSIMLDMFEGKSSAEETAIKMYEEYYGEEAPIDTCNCGCNEAEIRVAKTSYGDFNVAIQCKNCGYCVGGYGHTEEKAKLRAKTTWNEWLKTKDFAVWERGKNSYNK